MHSFKTRNIKIEHIIEKKRMDYSYNFICNMYFTIGTILAFTVFELASFAPEQKINKRSHEAKLCTVWEL